MPAETILRANMEPSFLLKWNSTKDAAHLTEDKLQALEQFEPVMVQTLLNLTASAVLATMRHNDSIKEQIKDKLPYELQDYLELSYKCWHCRKGTTGKPPVVIIRRVNLTPRQTLQDHGDGYAHWGYWGSAPTSVPCMFIFDTWSCYYTWHAEDDDDRIDKGHLGRYWHINKG